jgi:CubicO group peptidase (beta-lactamase class C family)
VLGFVERELARRVVAPGTVFNYASYLTNLLPILLERAYGVPAVELYERRLYGLLGAEQPAVVNLDRFDRPIVEGHVNLTLRDFARWAALYLDDGRSLDGRQVLPAWWVEEAYRRHPHRRAAFERSDYADLMPGAEYHNQAWLPRAGPSTLAMLGIHGQFAYLDPDQDLMMVGLSSYPDQVNPLLVALVSRAWDALTQAVD